MKRRLTVCSAITLLTLCISATLAHAHDPLFLTSEQSTPETGPYLPDGTISFAFYGEFLVERETRGFQVNFQEGDFFQLELLIPARAPEETLTTEQLPYLLILSPDGSEKALYHSIRTRFDEPFTNTSYYTLIRDQDTAMSGAYSITIVSRYAARFTAAIGTSERFGTPVERAGDRPPTLGETEKRIGDWYSKSKGVNTAESLDSQPIDDVPAEEPYSEPNTNSPGSNNKLSVEEDNITAGEQVTKEVVELTKPSNRAIWFMILLGIAVVPVALVIRRLRNPKP